MLKILFLLLFMGIAALFIRRGYVTGKRYIWIYSLSVLVATVVSIVLAVLLAKGIAWLLSGVIYNLVMGIGGLGNLRNMLNELSSANVAIIGFRPVALSNALAGAFFITSQHL